MRRFTDPILFGALFVLDVLAWLILSAVGGIETADPGRIAPMNVGTVIVIAVQALALATVVGLVRALLRVRPRQFYLWALGLAVTSAVISSVAALPAKAQNIEVGMSWAVWSNSILAFVFLIALIIATTGGIPTEVEPVVSTDDDTSAAPTTPSARHTLPERGSATPQADSTRTHPVSKLANTASGSTKWETTPQLGEAIPLKPPKQDTTVNNFGNFKDGQ